MLLKCPFVHSQLCASAFCIVEVFFCSLSIAHSVKSPILHSALHLCYISAFCSLCSYSTVNWIPQDIWSVYHVISAIWIAIICGGLCVHSQLCTSGSICLSWFCSHLHLFRFLPSSTQACPQYLPRLTRIYLTSSCSLAVGIVIVWAWIPVRCGLAIIRIWFGQRYECRDVLWKCTTCWPFWHLYSKKVF